MGRLRKKVVHLWRSRQIGLFAVACLVNKNRQTGAFLLFSYGLIYSTHMACLVLTPDQQLAGLLKRDFHSKKDRAYVLTDRSNEWTVMCQSLPLLTRWVNDHLSTGEKWDKVSLTGVFQNINQTGGRNGGYLKGKFRICSMPLAEAIDYFNVIRKTCRNAVVIGHKVRPSKVEKWIFWSRVRSARHMFFFVQRDIIFFFFRYVI